MQTDGQTYSKTDMTKLILVFLNFANTLKNKWRGENSECLKFDGNCAYIHTYIHMYSTVLQMVKMVTDWHRIIWVLFYKEFKA
jgi:hypothetical protein